MPLSFCGRYWFHKNIDKEWLPIGCSFRRVLADIVRVWPGPGRQGLQLLPINDITEPFVRVQSPHNDDASVQHVR